MGTSTWTVEVSRSALAECGLHHDLRQGLQPGQLWAEVESLAMTANTMTYAAMGEELGYWTLFPASAPGRGRVPAWGHARVLVSEVAGIVAGERLFGLWPMASHVLLSGRSSRRGLRETGAHRQALNPVYNQYALEPETHSPARELRALFHPLLVTSFVLAEHLAEQDCFGAGEVVILSASSKTALGTAFLVKGARRLVGLTSPAHAGWLAQTGLFDSVLAYEHLDKLGDVKRCLVLDFSGNPALLDRAVHALGDRCVRVIGVGATHGGAVGLRAASGGGPLNGMFSGPTHIERYAARWGPAAFDQRLQQALAAFTAAMRPNFTLRHHDGAAGMLAAYRELAQGRVAASTLLVARPVGQTDHELRPAVRRALPAGGRPQAVGCSHEPRPAVRRGSFPLGGTGRRP